MRKVPRFQHEQIIRGARIQSLPSGGLGERQGSEKEGLTNEAPSEQADAQPLILLNMSLYHDDVELSFITKEAGLRDIEEFIVDYESNNANTPEVEDEKSYKFIFTLADKEAGKDNFTWECKTIAGVSDHINTLYRKIKDGVFIFRDDLNNQPKPGNSVHFVNVFTIIQDEDKEIACFSRFCNSIAEVSYHLTDYSMYENDVHEIHIMVSEVNPQGGYEGMFRHMVKSYSDLKDYVKSLPWFAQVPSEDPDSSDGTE